MNSACRILNTIHRRNLWTTVSQWDKNEGYIIRYASDKQWNSYPDVYGVGTLNQTMYK